MDNRKPRSVKPNVRTSEKQPKQQKAFPVLPEHLVVGAFLIVLVGILVAGIMKPSYQVIQAIGGKYDAKLVVQNVTTTLGNTASIYKVIYTLEGKEVEGMLPRSMVPAFDKIRKDAPQNATFVMWWDYASALRGYTGRNVVLDSPSQKILYSVAGGWKGDLDPDERVQDVSSIFTTNLTTDAIKKMQDYQADYILVHISDVDKAFVFFSLPTGDSGDYLRYYSNGVVAPTPRGYSTMFFRMWRGEDIPGFFQFYMDNYTHIYRVDPTALSS